jgi:hypothetical protein
MATHETQPETLETVEPAAEDTTARDARLETPEPTPASTEQMLFADGELSDFRSRWTEVQAASWTIPATVCRRPTVWWPMSSTNSLLDSPRSARDSRTSGIEARKSRQRICVSR